MKVNPNYFQTYLSVINNSLGSPIYQHFYAEVDGQKKDILDSGALSCAYFVSVLLHQFQLIATPHARVGGLLKDLENSGWIKITEPKIGAILHWEEVKDHEHIGFYIGENQAISHREEEKTPTKHHWTFGEKDGQPIRKIISIFWHPKFNHPELWI